MVSCLGPGVKQGLSNISCEVMVLILATNDRNILQVSCVALELFGAFGLSSFVISLSQNTALPKIHRQIPALS